MVRTANPRDGSHARRLAHTAHVPSPRSFASSDAVGTRTRRPILMVGMSPRRAASKASPRLTPQETGACLGSPDTCSEATMSPGEESWMPAPHPPEFQHPDGRSLVFTRLALQQVQHESGYIVSIPGCTTRRPRPRSAPTGAATMRAALSPISLVAVCASSSAGTGGRCSDQVRQGTSCLGVEHVGDRRADLAGRGGVKSCQCRKGPDRPRQAG